eukprot:CAMPEP_0175371190 /NCGR_PEP_ID=MMETSP0095-20121207/21592_1 /TAXON_ID=311494 /ORGANISM="Alexandrium monilatum, Strain CCMP3105" /LENGTH=810 /DNA_ID=CAMNT_0016669355 /DNA_START=14 /DNA_END=2447 /DNA_ORIENTATION=-
MSAANCSARPTGEDQQPEERNVGAGNAPKAQPAECGAEDKRSAEMTCFPFLDTTAANSRALPPPDTVGVASSQSSSAKPAFDEDNPVAVFLREVGLGQYTEALLQSGFDDMETLRDIEDADMADLGIPRGHAVKLKKRLREIDGPAIEVETPPLNFADSVVSSRCVLPTDKMKTAVEESWEQVQTLGSEVVAEVLYRSLFELAPETALLFPADVRYRYRDWSADEGVDESDLYRSPAMRKLFAKVVNAVGTAVAGLQDLSRLVPMLTQLGSRHFSYGVKEEHFHAMGKALVRALQETLGDLFTLEVEFAWTMVYGFVSSIMISGMQAGSGRSVSIAKASLRSGGQDINGGREVYRIERHLQKAIFGDVYAATGLSSGRQFAVKVLDREMVTRFGTLQQDNQFCESPLCEVRYVEIMRGLDHVVQLEDHFGDQCYHFVVSELASGGDLLEALRLRPNGFKERQAQPLIREAAKGLLSLHQRGMAMQDVSLENMLLYVLEDGTWQVRICDPGQAVTFEVDPRNGMEEPVPFHGYVAKDFRPPEIYSKQEYLATRVDSWCLGWSTFYLLAAQPMFLSADPSVRDPDWILFQQGGALQLFGQKLGGWRNQLSEQACDFILRLMHIDPMQRLSVRDALRHPWLNEGQVKHVPPSYMAPRTSAPGRAGQQDFHASMRKDWCDSVPLRQWNVESGFEPRMEGPGMQVADYGGDKERERKEVMADLGNDCGLGGGFSLPSPDDHKMGDVPKIHGAQKPPPQNIQQVACEVPTLLHKSKAIKERMALTREGKKAWAMEAQQGRRGPQERKALDAPGGRS